MWLTIVFILGLSEAFFANGQRVQFPKPRPSGQRIDLSVSKFETTGGGGQNLASASASTSTQTGAPVLAWGPMDTKPEVAIDTTKGARGGGGDENPCPERFKLRCAPRQECYGRPGPDDYWPDPKDPRVNSTKGIPIPVTLSGDKDKSYPRVVNNPPEGVVCKQNELYCCAPIPEGKPPPPTTPPPPKFDCGVSYTIPTPLDEKMVYGQTAFGQYPWMSVIYSGDDYIASGALISDRHIVTVAHKFDEVNLPTKVRFGMWDIDRDFTEPYNIVTISVDKTVIHHHFNRVTLHNDIAILTLSHPVHFHKHPHIRPVCLPTKKNYVGQRCWVSGFGKNAFNSDKGLSRVLNEVDLPVMDGNECEKRLQTQMSRPFDLNRDSFLCAGGVENGKDTCSGDGGAPLVCRNHEKGQKPRFEAVGLVSWGIGCGKPGIPGVYVNLAKYVDWIQDMSKT